MRGWKSWQAGVALTLLGAAAAAPGPVAAQQMYRCGGAYQDRPCASEEAQRRYSSSSNRFTMGKPDPNLPRRCAQIAEEALPYWRRAYGGEPLDKLRAEIDATPVSAEQREQTRNSLVIMNGLAGTERQVRSQFEENCVVQARRNASAPKSAAPAAKPAKPAASSAKP